MKAHPALKVLFLACVAVMASTAGAQPKFTPLAIHPDNPRYFLFRGKPLVLITATEHYGSVINRPFDFEKYLADHAEKRQTFTRTFLLFRELQTSKNPPSPCKPESPDYIAPWLRIGKEPAADGEPKFDLDQWNPEFFERLHRFLRRSSELGVVVELTFFSNSYNERIWDLNPLCPKNNLQGIGPAHWTWYTTLKDAKLVERQRAFVRKSSGKPPRATTTSITKSATSPAATGRARPRSRRSRRGRWRSRKRSARSWKNSAPNTSSPARRRTRSSPSSVSLMTTP